MSSDNIQKALDHIENSREDSLFLPIELREKFQLTDQEVKNEVILPLLKSGIVIPVYKLNTDLYFPNEWSPNLLGLSRKFKLKNGKEFDGSDPKNILVAFKKQLSF